MSRRQPTAESIALRLREARAASGKTQAELAAAVGASYQMISAYERGLREPGAILLAKLARALGVTTDELLK